MKFKFQKQYQPFIDQATGVYDDYIKRYRPTTILNNFNIVHNFHTGTKPSRLRYNIPSRDDIIMLLALELYGRERDDLKRA